MSECRFQFEFPGSGAALVDKIRTKMTAAGGQLDAVAQTLNKTIGMICGPLQFDQFFEVVDFLAASGAGGLGLGASIDVEQIPVSRVEPMTPPAASSHKTP